MAGEEATATLGAATSGRALDNDAVGHNRSAGKRETLSVVGNLLVPNQLAGLGIDREQMGVAGRDDNVVAVDRLGTHPADSRIIRQLVFILPDQLAVGRVECLDCVVGVLDVHDPVMDHRSLLCPPPRRQAPGPSQPEIADVVLVDLVERAVTPAVVSAPPHQPVAIGRVEQHLVGDRRNAVNRVVLGHSKTYRRAIGHGRKQQNTLDPWFLRHFKFPPLPGYLSLAIGSCLAVSCDGRRQAR